MTRERDAARTPDRANRSARQRRERDTTRVLFVTADGDDTDATTALRADSRFTVSTTNAADVLDELDDGANVDCVVSEYRLDSDDSHDDSDDDGNDGVAVLSRVVDDSRTIPSVLVSADAVSGLPAEALSAGVTDYVHRPPGDGVELLARRILSAVAGDVPTADELAEEGDSGREPSVERYRSLAEDVFGESDVGVFVLDDAGDVAWANRTVETYFGLDETVPEGWEMAELVTDRLEARVVDADGLAGGLADVYRTDDPAEEFEIHVTSSENRPERYLQYRSQPIESGEYAGGRLELYYDVSERKRQERELRETKERLEVATEAGSLGTWTWEFDTDVVTADQSLAAAYGMDPETTVSGAHIEEFFEPVHEADREEVWRSLDEAVEETGEFAAEYRVRDGSGDVSWVSSRGEVEYDEDGEALRMNGALTDVTDRRRRERELQETKERLEVAMTVGSVGTWDWNVTEDEVLADAALADLFGLDPADAREGMPLETFLSSIHPDDRRETKREIDATLASGGSFEHEYRVVSADETVRWVLARGEVEFEDGEAVRFTGALSDITKRKRAERELEESQFYLRELYEIASDTGSTFEKKVDRFLQLGCDRLGVDYGFLIEVDEEADAFNVAAMYGTHEKFHEGLSAPLRDTYCKHVVGSPSGFSIRDAVAEGFADDPAYGSGLSCYLGSEVVVDGETFGTFCFADTTPRDDPFTDAEQTFAELMTEWVGYGLERRRAQAEIEATVEKLERSNDRLERFAYVASHDLTEPLRMVSSYVQLLERRYGDELDEDAREFVDYAVDGADRMREMIDGLLTYSRVDTQGNPLEPTEMDLVFDRTVSNLELAIEESDATVTADPLPTVRGDETQLLTLLQNLVSNAVRYSGDDPPVVHVAADRRDDEWVFSVRDEGIGMDPDRTDGIFQIFERLHTSAEYEGTGIGLAVCRSIVERHGGRIWAESEPGAGSTFFFTIPA
ncbi:PAS domain-containing protein [Halogeometricum limi]|uniref:histidine kinase n=1 Tax=Halogeometricum limi TaxID=555875 RepID=A0A1I6FR21_9EURY|nr:PAS domain-containing protein [Halogeometricum limi]SFR32344.1 PAS domain S-box-containing protein [Halogeometricum limi]